jgi:Ankyrin repeats (3 copies)
MLSLLEALPEELKLEVVKHLHLISYHTLRQCSKLLYTLAKVPTLTFIAYQESQEKLKNCDGMMQLIHYDIMDESFVYLAEQQHVAEFRRVLRSPGGQFITHYTKERIFDFILANDFDSEMILALICDGHIDPSGKYQYDGLRCALHLLEWACQRGDSELVRLLIQDNRFDPSTLDQPLTHAIYGGNLESVKLLVEDARIDLESEDSPVAVAIFHASHNTSVIPILEYLLDSSRIRNVSEMQGLFMAALFGSPDVTKVLLGDGRYDGSLDSLNEVGKTPAEMAAYLGNHEVAEIITEHGNNQKRASR